MHIVLDDRIEPNTGSSRYVKSLSKHFYDMGNDIRISLFQKQFNTKFTKVNLLATLIYESLWMGKYLKSQKCDIFHCTKNYGVPFNVNIPIVTTIHDLIPLVLSSDYAKTYVRRLFFMYNFSNTVNKSHAIITISKFSLSEIRRLYPNINCEIYHIPQGCGLNSDIISYDESCRIMAGFGVNRPYILVMGGAEPRKNVSMVIKLFNDNFHSIPCDLVVIGGQWGGEEISFPRRRVGQFHILHGLSERQLVAAYKASTLFVFPSIYEGFGLPVLEAMASGTPVLAHNATSIPEVAGSAAMLVDMTDPNECLKGLLRLLSERSLREELRHAGLERVKMFTWEKTAAETFEVYKSVLSQ